MSDEQARNQFMGEIRGICEARDTEDYRAFPRWVCDNILGIRGDSAIDEAVSVGDSNGYGIDIFHTDDMIDAADQYVCLVRIKFSGTLDCRVTREEILSFRESVGYLENCPDDASPAFRQRSDEFKTIRRDNPGTRIVMLFAVTGSLDEQAREAVRLDPDQMAADGGSKPDIRILDMPEIISHVITPRTPDIRIGFSGDPVRRTDPVTRKKSMLGYVNAGDLIKAVGPHKGPAYLENPGEYLGVFSSTDKAITATIGDAELRKRFWRLNNGITATCDGFEPAGREPNTFTVKNFRVVNGRQTTSTLERSAAPLDDVFVLLTVHEVAAPEEHRLISRTTNTQNPIRPLDLIANTSQLRDLVLQCRHDFKEFYFERQARGFDAASPQTRNRVTPRRVLEKGDAARAYCAYAVDPNDAMLPDGELFSTTEPVHFDRIFQGRRIRDLIIPHIFMAALDELCDGWKKGTRDQKPSTSHMREGKANAEIFGKKITKYFVLRFIGMSMASMDEKQRRAVEEKAIGIFRGLEKMDRIPEPVINVVKTVCECFMRWFVARWRDTWPPHLAEKMSEVGYKNYSGGEPTAYDIMRQLKKDGRSILHVFREEREYQINVADSKDVVVSALQELEKYEVPGQMVHGDQV